MRGSPQMGERALSSTPAGRDRPRVMESNGFQKKDQIHRKKSAAQGQGG